MYIHLLFISFSLRGPVMDVCICHIKGKSSLVFAHRIYLSALPAISPLSLLSALFYFFHLPALAFSFKPDWCQPRNNLGVKSAKGVCVSACTFLLVLLSL